MLLSAALLSVDIKICAVIGVAIEGFAVVLIAFAILIAFGYFFEGPRSGMTIGLAYQIGKMIVKVASFFYSIWEKIMIAVAKMEFSILRIEFQNKKMEGIHSNNDKKSLIFRN